MLFGLLANGSVGLQADDLLQAGETVLPPLQKNIQILNAGPAKRAFIDFALKHILGEGRLRDLLDGLRKMPARDFERFLKRRTEWIHDFADKW